MKYTTGVHQSYLLLGSNLGDREDHLNKACQLLGNEVTINGRSSIYRTKAWGKTDQPDFLNQVISVKTESDPDGLLQFVLSVETAMGRHRTEKWGPRLIDIDIQFFDNLVINNDHLKIPHPELHKRMFTLKPLNELAPELIHPVLRKSISELLKECPDQLEVTRYQATR